ncbi:hypothetical protein NUU61_004976 [Penicillium alfredii]|uniref:Uncharacterized protein n=1 Tax=Penicillium alfredii TaxID=1506179 RepID=A0A9W9F8R2_9EURO|nr:uncharacterized protein NUU61_004976 [Penicillium alfredii]KAJ5095620.1 hypothetical protein NUU61_004976 [Penicillium alfredii]
MSIKTTYDPQFPVIACPGHVVELSSDNSPFSGLIVLYGVNSAQNALSNTAEYKNDPRNPNAKSGNAGH